MFFELFWGSLGGDPIGPTKCLCTRVLLQNAMLMTKVIRETRRPALEGSKQSWLLQGGFQESPSTRCQSHVESHCVVERNCMDSLNLGEIRLSAKKSTSLVELDTLDCNLNFKVRQKHCSEIVLPFRATEQQKGFQTYKLIFT